MPSVTILVIEDDDRMRTSIAYPVRRPASRRTQAQAKVAAAGEVREGLLFP
jgi:hypothetical protein